jgi:hypothetical protein
MLGFQALVVSALVSGYIFTEDEQPPVEVPDDNDDVGYGTFPRAVDNRTNSMDISYNAKDIHTRFSPNKEKTSREREEDERNLREGVEAFERAALQKEQKILGEIELLKSQAAQAQGRAGIYKQGSEKLDAKMIALRAELELTKRQAALAHAKRVALHRKMVEDDEDDAMTMLATMLLH